MTAPYNLIRHPGYTSRRIYFPESCMMHGNSGRGCARWMDVLCILNHCRSCSPLGIGFGTTLLSRTEKDPFHRKGIWRGTSELGTEGRVMLCAAMGRMAA